MVKRPGRKRVTEHAKDTALARIEMSIPREDVRAVLEKLNDPRAAHLMNLLIDVSQHKFSLANLCHKAGIPYEDFLYMLTKGRLGDGIERMSRHAPKVFEDIAVDSESMLVNCPECKGTRQIVRGKGKHAEYVECWVCAGTGKLRKPGDTDARKLMFESLGLTNKNKSGLAVNVNVNGTGMKTVEDEMDLVGEVIDVNATSNG